MLRVLGSHFENHRPRKSTRLPCSLEGSTFLCEGERVVFIAWFIFSRILRDWKLREGHLHVAVQVPGSQVHSAPEESRSLEWQNLFFFSIFDNWNPSHYFEEVRKIGLFPELKETDAK